MRYTRKMPRRVGIKPGESFMLAILKQGALAAGLAALMTLASGAALALDKVRIG